MPIFRLTLQKTYYEKGFFNVTVDFDRDVRSVEGPVQLRLGRTGQIISGKINRSANQNGTPRILGGPKLRDWFQSHFKPMTVIGVDLSSKNIIILDKL